MSESLKQVASGSRMSRAGFGICGVNYRYAVPVVGSYEASQMTNTQLYIAVGVPIREIRVDIKLLTGKVYEMMGQKS